MKVNVSVEANAQELREFFGLPNVQPLQQEILQTVRDNMKKGVTGFDPLSLMKPVLSTQTPLEVWQKTFWDTFAKANEPAQDDSEQVDKK
ncbi:MAG: DUF6489 family protein [Candidatus Competibacteraceae bacterium]|jgi:hypothetical protein|nr:DUF6489 family protein [Candidatus Competibacteraceae bacterium]